ncbi:plasmid transfer protein TraA [Streptomyces sp. NPDC002536]
MATPPPPPPFNGPWAAGPGRQQQNAWKNANGTRGGGDRYRTTNRASEYHFHFGNQNGGSSRGGGANGDSGFFRRDGRRQGGTHSPLADPEFFSNVDIRNYCERGRQLFLQLSFELANASEVLHAVLKEVPDPEGKAFGSRMRARRVAKRMKKAAEDTRDTAKNLAATYASFQREFDPELAPYRTRQRPNRRFDFNS